MTLRPVLIDGTWCQAEVPAGSYRATNPATRAALDNEFPVSGRRDVERAVAAALRAVPELATAGSAKVARFLELCADRIELRKEALVETAHLETALPTSPRLKDVELPRTTNQLRQAAAAARDGSWCLPTIDTKNNIRSKLGPLAGPVVVFGPNNFPFAFNSAAGGDFAAAIAAGNPVIAVSNSSHPGTTELMAQAAFEAIEESEMPRATVQLLYRLPRELGLELVAHSAVGASAFTGSRQAGLSLKAAADVAGKPIYLEMSSVNPVFILPGALAERGSDLAKELFTSASMGAGQFCTSPGLTVVLDDQHSAAFLNVLRDLFASQPSGTLLGPGVLDHLGKSVETLRAAGAELLCGGQEVPGPACRFANTLLRVSGARFLERAEALQTEAFGTVNLVVVARDLPEMIAVAQQLDGNLTGAIYSHTRGDDDAVYRELEPTLRRKVGRLLNDKMPTGVAISPAMNHGGPYPATGHPGFTAVGIPASLRRFAALHCYDAVRDHRLPPELKNANPTGKLWRNIDGAWTQSDVTPA